MMSAVDHDPKTRTNVRPLDATRNDLVAYLENAKPAKKLPEITHLETIRGTWLYSMMWRPLDVKTPDGDRYRRFVPKSCVANAVTTLCKDRRWRGVLAYDEFAECVVTRAQPPWHEDGAAGAELGEWTDADTMRLRIWLERVMGITLAAGEADGVVSLAASAHRFHPVREYLRGLTWDGEPRLELFLANYLGTEPNDYTRAIGKRWLVSAVARIMRPGCQVDCTLILEGAQGIGKTSALRALVPIASWYADTGIEIGDKDSYQNLRGVWMYGLDELDSLKRGDVTRIKNFLTQTKDHYRASYARRARDYLRQNVFAGTTNEEHYLVDSDNRRFWPARVTRAVNPTRIATDRAQIWAEAVACFDRGDPWHVDTPELRTMCEEQQRGRRQPDPWTPTVAEWLAKPTSYDSLLGVLTTDVLHKALSVPLGEMTKADERRVTDILRELGYMRGPQRRENGIRVRRWSPASTAVSTLASDENS
jgi:putative DNA primase/helicase